MEEVVLLGWMDTLRAMIIDEDAKNSRRNLG
jgi:hypothetical protein